MRRFRTDIDGRFEFLGQPPGEFVQIVLEE
jgi:hypothetical protein